MSQPKVSSRRNEVSRLLRLAELEATDERAHRECVEELTDPEILGYSNNDAEVVSAAIRKDMLRRIFAETEIEIEDEDGDEGEAPQGAGEEEAEAPKKETKPEEKADDVVEFEEDGEEFPKSKEDVTLGEGLGFPDEEEDELEGEAPAGPECEGPACDAKPEGETGLGGLEGLEGAGEGGLPGEVVPPMMPMGPEGLEGLPAADEGEIPGAAQSVPVEPGGTVSLELPDGSSLEIKLTKEVMAAIKHSEEVEAMNRERMGSAPSGQPSREEFLAVRSAQRNALRQILAAQETDDLKAKEIGTGRALGDDTAHSGDGKGGGKKFQMEDGTHGIANPGNVNKHETMTMTSSEGNSLLTDPQFTPNALYTKQRDLLTVPNALDFKSFEQEQDGLYTKNIEASDTPDPLPTTGMGPDFWGWDKGFEQFKVPTQLSQYTADRFPQVAQAAAERKGFVVEAAMNRYCMGCTDPQGNVEPVTCEDCGDDYALCEACIGQGHCPTCSARSAAMANHGMYAEAGINWDAYCGTAKDRAEVCEDTRGEDPNGDGGFRTKDKIGRMPKADDARDMELDAGEFEKSASVRYEMDELAKQNQQLQIQMARLVKATEVAGEMVANGQIAPDAVNAHVDKWMSDGMTVQALENFRQLAAGIGQREYQTKIAAVEQGMERTASPHRIRPATAGLSFNPNPTREAAYGSGELFEALTEMLKDNLPRPTDFDERTGVRMQYR